MGQSLRTRYLMAAFTVSLCALGAVASGPLSAQTVEPTDANATVIDDGDAQYAHMNFTTTSFLGAYTEDTSYFYPPSLQAGAVAMAQWTFKGVQPGDYLVYATWKKHSAFSKDAKYAVKSASWTGQVETASIDQSIEPVGVNYKNREWKPIGAVTIVNADDVVVTVKPGSDASRYTIADAVMIVKVGGTVTGPRCLTPVCAAPPAGCSYVADPAVGANGCLVNPCGILKCEPIHSAAPACGDGIVQTGEQCDDGNLTPGDSCSPTCQIKCGDGVVSAGETCDLGSQNGASQGTYMCTAQCAWAYCGDGILQQKLGEQCDGTAGCTRDCKIVPIPTASCTDSDGGNYPDVKGTVAEKTSTVANAMTDTCLNATTVVEYVCSGNLAGRTTATCANGCADGACKAAPTTGGQCTGPAATGSSLQNQSNTLDANKDGVVNDADMKDVTAYVRLLALGGKPTKYVLPDVDGNRSINDQDVVSVSTYLRCSQPSITMRGSTFSCVNGVTNLALTYDARNVSANLHVVNDKNAIVHDGTSVPSSMGSVGMATLQLPLAFNVPANIGIKVCDSTKIDANKNYTLCSPLLPSTGSSCQFSIALTSVVIGKEGADDVAKVTYEKNFDTCVHMLSPAGSILHVQNHFCAKSGTIIAKLSDGLKVKEGDSVKLCHGNNYGICSAVVKVTKETVAADAVSLAGVVMTCRDGVDHVNVTYKKNFATCAHLQTAAGVKFGTQNFFCENDTSKLVKASDLPGLALGTQVKLCHGNNTGVCSPLVTVTGATCTATIAPVLNVAVKSIGTTDTAVKNQKDVNLLRFTARSDGQDVFVSTFVFNAKAGSLLNAQNYALWFDSDADGVVDAILESGVVVRGDIISFNNMTGDGKTIPNNSEMLFEVHADIASSLTSNSLQLGFATTTSGYIIAHVGNGVHLAGIKTDGVCAGTCAIAVWTVPSKAFTLVSQGDLFVTLDSTPTRSRQMLGGTLSESVLRMQFRAQNEAIDVTDLRIYSGSASTASSIDRYELFFDGATTPFATATVSGCGSDQVAANTFCANMDDGQLVVNDGENKDVLVRARVKSDEQGATTGQRIQLVLLPPNGTIVSAVDARGRVSSSNLNRNDGDAANEGEVFIGTDYVSVNQAVKGNKHVVVLSKFTSITNANPDADNTNVPTGVSPIGQFKFTAATNGNTLNGLNKATLRKLKFTVAATNVSLNLANFKFYNKADSSTKKPCVSIIVGAQYAVECSGLDTSGLDTELESGESSTFVLEADVTNSKVSSTAASSLQVSLENFATPYLANTNLEWLDKDAGAGISGGFNWIEYSDTVVRSTLYKS
jgi:cysteine-rich repeat protein